MSVAQFCVGNVFERLAEIPDGSVDLVVTSPPFLALRSYLPPGHPDKAKEIGSEATPAAFLSTLLALTREFRRVLAPHGSIAVELGDTYSGSGGAGGDYGDGGLRDGQPRFKSQRKNGRDWAKSDNNPARRNPAVGWPMDKSLCGIPTLYAWSLAYGRNLLDPTDALEPWRVRNLIVWHRPNPPVGALGDKVRPSTSYVTAACVARDRWFDLDAERTPAQVQTPRNTNGVKGGSVHPGEEGLIKQFNVRIDSNPAGAPPLDCWFDDTTDDVWTIPTQGFKGAHYATFPIALPRKLINLMCPRQVCITCGEPRRRITENPNAGTGRNAWNGSVGESGFGDRPNIAERIMLGWTDCGHDSWRRGIVLDPFAGSGTTLAAASEQGRDSIGIDLDERNLNLARERVGMFLEEVV